MKIIYKTKKNYRNAKSFLFGLKGLSTYENEITLPLYSKLTMKEVDYIIKNFIEVLKEFKLC